MVWVGAIEDKSYSLKKKIEGHFKSIFFQSESGGGFGAVVSGLFGPEMGRVFFAGGCRSFWA